MIDPELVKTVALIGAMLCLAAIGVIAMVDFVRGRKKDAS